MFFKMLFKKFKSKKNNFFGKIPNEIIIEIFSCLSPKDLTQINLVNKMFYKLSKSNAVRGRFLKKDKRNKNENNIYGKEDEKNYRQHVTFRRTGYIHYGKAGKNYLENRINATLKRTGLTDVQKAHLGSARVRQLICTERLTIEEALYNSSPTQVIDLNKYQIQGIKAGLTREQVKNSWFSYWHAKAAVANISYDQYKELTMDQVRYGILKGLERGQVVGLNWCQIEGMGAGLTQEQVMHDWFGYWHAKAAKNNIPYNQYKGLTLLQIKYGIFNDLKRWQVENDWFGYWHGKAAENNIPYDQYKGLTEDQVRYGILDDLKRAQVVGLKNKHQIQGIKVGLTRKQVMHDWFGYWHTIAAKVKIPYEDYKGLSEDKVRILYFKLLYYRRLCFKPKVKYDQKSLFNYALEMYKKSKCSDSEDAKILRDMGAFCNGQGGDKDAVFCFWQSIKLDPNYLKPAWNLADIFMKQANGEELTNLLNFLGRKGYKALPKLRSMVAKHWPLFYKKYHEKELKNAFDHTHSIPVKMFGCF
ncbi:MAG: F-box protein [Gammaproteobacteria bacterium]|jgi:hypothetical protein